MEKNFSGLLYLSEGNPVVRGFQIFFAVSLSKLWNKQWRWQYKWMEGEDAWQPNSNKSAFGNLWMCLNPRFYSYFIEHMNLFFTSFSQNTSHSLSACNAIKGRCISSLSPVSMFIRAFHVDATFPMSWVCSKFQWWRSHVYVAFISQGVRFHTFSQPLTYFTKFWMSFFVHNSETFASLECRDAFYIYGTVIIVISIFFILWDDEICYCKHDVLWRSKPVHYWKKQYNFFVYKRCQVFSSVTNCICL